MVEIHVKDAKEMAEFLERFNGNFRSAVTQTVTDVVNEIVEAAVQNYVPYDKGTLAQSLPKAVSIKTLAGGRIEGHFGSRLIYARAQHYRLDYSHPSLKRQRLLSNLTIASMFNKDKRKAKKLSRLVNEERARQSRPGEAMYLSIPRDKKKPEIPGRLQEAILSAVEASR